MKTAVKRKLDKLRCDYQAVTGSPFSHFYCPILFQDDNTALCEAHIVNKAFAESARRSTVQRTDVDNFYGRFFEADFEKTQYWKMPPNQIIADPALSNKLRPEILLGGEVIEHFLARGPVPDHLTEAIADGGVRLGLKIHPDDAIIAIGKGCEMRIGQDARLPALVSLLKAAHLTLFDLLGYRYALSQGGRFLGRTVLGDFFFENESLGKADVLKNAVSHFAKFANMVRPLLDSPVEVHGTASDGLLFVCFLEPQTLWAYIVFIRTSKELHAVLVPILEEPSAAARFKTFLCGEVGPIPAKRCRIEGDRLWINTQSETMMWPDAPFL
jgi:hypothetical protein